MRSSEPTAQKTSSINGNVNKSISPRVSISAFTKAGGRKMLISFEDMIQKEKILTISIDCMQSAVSMTCVCKYFSNTTTFPIQFFRINLSFYSYCL